MQNDAKYVTRNHAVSSFLKDCTACGACQAACPFLEIHGTPDVILQSSDDTVFLCTNCRACIALCPIGLSPADVFFSAKADRIRNDLLSARVRHALSGAQSYARRGHSFPFSAWRTAEIVFWPGCGLTGGLPEVVRAAHRELALFLNEPVGLILDCCFDPAYQLGDLDTVQAALQEIGSRLESGGVRRLITGCVNCTKVLSGSLSGIRIEHVLDILPPASFRRNNIPSIMHHPCSSSRIAGLPAKAAACCGSAYHEADPPACCGCGGGLHVIDALLAKAFSGRTLGAVSNESVVTYCAGCRSVFRAAGKQAVHLLEYLPGVTPGMPHPGSVRKWFNRFLARMRAKTERGGEA